MDGLGSGATLATLLALAAVAALCLPAGAIAGDAIAVYEPEPASQAASPGETVEIDVVLRSDGGYAGEGLGSYRFVVAAHPDVVAIESVDAGPYLAGDGGEVQASTTTVEDGTVLVEHERVGAEEGPTGADVAATVTLTVREDAPAANATVAVLDPETELARGDYPMRSFGREANLTIDGGGEHYEPQYQPSGTPGSADGGGGDNGDDGVGVTTAAERNRTVDVDRDGGGGAAGDDADGSTDDAVPGFGALAAFAALVVGTGVFVALSTARSRGQ